MFLKTTYNLSTVKMRYHETFKNGFWPLFGDSRVILGKKLFLNLFVLQ